MSRYHSDKKTNILAESYREVKQFIHGLRYKGFIQPTYVYDQALEKFEDGKEITEIKIHNMDTFETAELYIKNANVTYQNVCVLNMASDRVPGGGTITGKGNAQEEKLCRRSSLMLSLDTRQFKPLTGHSHQPLITYPWESPLRCVYSEGVMVFRDIDEQMLHKNNCFLLNVVSAAAIRYPKLIKSYTEYANQKDKDLMIEKIKMILRVCILHKVDVLVLGAFGCGAFQNPAEDVARIFNQLLRSTPEFYNKFKVIAFAIIDNKYSNNYRIFKKILVDDHK